MRMCWRGADVYGLHVGVLWCLEQRGAVRSVDPLGLHSMDLMSAEQARATAQVGGGQAEGGTEQNNHTRQI